MRFCSFLAGVAALFTLGAAGAGGHARTHEEPPRGRWLPTYTIEYGGFRQLNAYAPIDRASGWGIDVTEGERGFQSLFIRRAATSWWVPQIAFGASLSALDTAPDGSGFAVGRRGAIYRLSRDFWSPMASPTGNDLQAVAVRQPDDAWAVGTLGTVLHWDGVQWQQQAFPDDLANLADVAVDDEGTAWIVSREGDVYRTTDQGWVRDATAPGVPRATSIAFGQGGWGLAAGEGLIERRGGAWRQVDGPAAVYEALAVAGDRAYAAAEGRLFTASGAGAWVPVAMDATLPAGLQLNGVAATGTSATAWGRSGPVADVAGTTASRAWPLMGTVFDLSSDAATGEVVAGGAAYESGMQAMIRRAGGGWVGDGIAGDNTLLSDVELTAPNEGWALGSTVQIPSRGRIFQYDGQGWREYTLDPLIVLTRMSVVAPNDIWASGTNGVARWNGDAWKVVEGAPHGAVRGPIAMLAGSPDPMGWLGGNGILWEVQGTTWTDHPLPVADDVTGLATWRDTPDAGVWAMTEHSLYLWRGGDWTENAPPLHAGETLLDLQGPDPENLWLLTSERRLLQWRGDLVAWNAHDLYPFGHQAGFSSIKVNRDEAVDGWLVQLLGSPPTIASYKVVTPAVSLYLPKAVTARD